MQHHQFSKSYLSTALVAISMGFFVFYAFKDLITAAPWFMPLAGGVMGVTLVLSFILIHVMHHLTTHKIDTGNIKATRTSRAPRISIRKVAPRD